MVSGFVTNQEKLSFREICLAHLKKILELSCNEFCGGYWEIKGGNPTTRIYVPDSRACYIQAVENFAIILVPHFDEQMKTDYQRYKKELEIKNLIKQLKSNVKLHFKVRGKPSEDKDVEAWLNEKKSNYDLNITEIKLKKAHILFENLNELLSRRDYLTTALYEEGDEEE